MKPSMRIQIMIIRKLKSEVLVNSSNEIEFIIIRSDNEHNSTIYKLKNGQILYFIYFYN